MCWSLRLPVAPSWTDWTAGASQIHQFLESPWKRTAASLVRLLEEGRASSARVTSHHPVTTGTGHTLPWKQVSYPLLVTSPSPITTGTGRTLRWKQVSYPLLLCRPYLAGMDIGPIQPCLSHTQLHTVLQNQTHRLSQVGTGPYWNLRF